jgi:hypothetical protein
MRPLGDRHTRTGTPGHQNCGICHPPLKGRKARERRASKTVTRDAALGEICMFYSDWPSWKEAGEIDIDCY